MWNRKGGKGQDSLYKGPSAPVDTQKQWLDTSKVPWIFKFYNTNTSLWEPVGGSSTTEPPTTGDVIETNDRLYITAAERGLLSGASANLQGQLDNKQSQINALTNGMKYKGQVANKAGLPASGNQTGDTFIVLADETDSGKKNTYVFDGTAFVNIGTTDVVAGAAIDDVTPSTTKVWSSSKAKSEDDAIKNSLTSKADTAAVYTKAQVDAKTGNLAGLTTTTQASLVAAINEVNGKVGPGGGGGGAALTQSTKLGVTASSGTPKIVDLAIPFTIDFNRPPVEVLKLTPGTQNQVSTFTSFDNGNTSDFAADSQLVFDGMMSMKTVYQSTMVNEGPAGSNVIISYTINLDDFKTIEKLEVI